MNADEAVRSSEARAAAELALVRVVHHYGDKPGFVLLGGLVPPLLCSHSAFRHAGTTDVDVQVDIEIASGATHTRRLEQALTNAEFRPDTERVWRWEMRTDTGRKTRVKFELLEGHGRYGAARHRLPRHHHLRERAIDHRQRYPCPPDGVCLALPHLIGAGGGD